MPSVSHLHSSVFISFVPRWACLLLLQLTARNDRRRKADRTEMVKIVVRELVDLGVRIGSRRRSRRGVSRSFLDDSAEMFVRGRPLWEDALNDSIHMLLDPRFVDDNRPRTDDALKTQSVLNRRDVSQYLKRSGNWWGRALLGTTDQQDPASELRVLGFLVHDVLASIHALPASLVDTRNVALAPITAVLERDDNDDDDDDALIRELCIALDKRNMTAVLPRTAVQYCLSAYCRCSDAGELAKLLENNQGVTTDSSGNYCDVVFSVVTNRSRFSCRTKRKVVPEYRGAKRD